jgi:hypothetical protein
MCQAATLRRNPLPVRLVPNAPSSASRAASVTCSAATSAAIASRQLACAWWWWWRCARVPGQHGTAGSTARPPTLCTAASPPTCVSVACTPHLCMLQACCVQQLVVCLLPPRSSCCSICHASCIIVAPSLQQSHGGAVTRATAGQQLRALHMLLQEGVVQGGVQGLQVWWWQRKRHRLAPVLLLGAPISSCNCCCCRSAARSPVDACASPLAAARCVTRVQGRPPRGRHAAFAVVRWAARALPPFPKRYDLLRRDRHRTPGLGAGC